MGVFLDLLRSEHFRQRPGMYAGDRAFAFVGPWLDGFEAGVRQALPDQPRELDGFREWLRMRLDGPGNVRWTGIIADRYGRGVEATEMMFQLLDAFLADRDMQGTEAIVRAHAEWERRVHGYQSPESMRDV